MTWQPPPPPPPPPWAMPLAAAALTAFWLAPETPLTLAASAAEALATGVLAWQFTVYADLPGQPVRGAAE
jgi:hypothetical protein